MNKQHRIVWSTNTQAWVVVSENTRSHSKKSSLTKAAVGAAITTAALFALPAQAGCDIASPPTTGSVVSCTGSTTATYDITEQNVTLTNDGAWTVSGTQNPVIPPQKSII